MNIELDEERNNFLEQYQSKGVHRAFFLLKKIHFSKRNNFLFILVTQNQHDINIDRMNVQPNVEYKNKNLIE